MEVDYIFLVSNLRSLAKDRGLPCYSKLRKADLISLLRSHDASTRTFTEKGAQESNNEVDSFDNPTIMEEGGTI